MSGTGSGPATRMVAITDVKLSKRVRRDKGDLRGLADSIDKRGLLQPIGLTSDNELIWGERRYLACKLLKWTEIPAVVPTGMDDLADRLAAERDENTERKDWTPSEKVAMADRLRTALEQQARQRWEATKAKRGERVGAQKPRSQGGVQLPTAYKGKTRDQVAALVGTSDRTLRGARVVVEAERDPDPQVREVAKQARREMDRSGKVAPAVEKVRKAQSRGVSGAFSLLGIYEYTVGSGEARYGIEWWGGQGRVGRRYKKQGFSTPEAAKEHRERIDREEKEKWRAQEWPRQVREYKDHLWAFQQNFSRTDIDLVEMIEAMRAKGSVSFTTGGIRRGAQWILEFADAWEKSN